MVCRPLSNRNPSGLWRTRRVRRQRVKWLSPAAFGIIRFRLRGQFEEPRSGLEWQRHGKLVSDLRNIVGDRRPHDGRIQAVSLHELAACSPIRPGDHQFSIGDADGQRRAIQADASAEFRGVVVQRGGCGDEEASRQEYGQGFGEYRVPVDIGGDDRAANECLALTVTGGIRTFIGEELKDDAWSVRDGVQGAADNQDPTAGLS